MSKANSFRAIILLVAIVLSSELAIMYTIDHAALGAVLSPSALSSVDAILLTIIATLAVYGLFVVPLRKSMRKNAQLASAISHTSMGYLSYDPHLIDGEFVYVN